MGKLLRTSFHFLLTHTISTRFISSLILLFCSIYLVVSPVTEISLQYNVNINMGILPLTTGAPFMVSMLFNVVFYFFSDLPIKFPSPYFLIARSGKRRWVFAQLIYVVEVSIILTVFIIISTLTICLGRIYFDCEHWGKIINSIAAGQLNIPELEFRLETTDLIGWTPASAIIWSIISLILTITLFGFISIVMNLFISEFCGTICNGIIIFIHLLFGFFPENTMYYFSPIEWCGIRNVGRSSISMRPDIIYIIMIWVVVFFLLVFLAFVLTAKKQDFLIKMERTIK